jgi:hypothetical protein
MKKQASVILLTIEAFCIPESPDLRLGPPALVVAGVPCWRRPFSHIVGKMWIIYRATLTINVQQAYLNIEPLTAAGTRPCLTS